jgi:signal transduction histidine kinase
VSNALTPRLMARRLQQRLPAGTIRLRLTLVYGALFLLSGAALLTITYFLVRRQYTGSFFITSGKASVIAVAGKTQSLEAPFGVPDTFGGPSPEAIVAAARAQSSAALHQLLVDSGIALGVMAVLSICLGWVIAGRALRPLRTITNAARDISASNLHRRLALEGPDDELKRLGNTFDELLERLEAGQDVPSSELDRLFRPFQRLEPARTGNRNGLGLGLSIVDAVARAHDATVAARPEPGGGLHVEVSFPGVL